MIFLISLSPLTQIAPALLGLSASALFLIYFCYEKNKTGILVCTFIFLSSGFFLQTLDSNIELINQFLDRYNRLFNVSLIISALTSATGIFLSNRFLKKREERKERRKVSVLFYQAVKSQLIHLEFIFQECIKGNVYGIRIEPRLVQLENNKFYETSFQQIGIYDEQEIDWISQYSVTLQESLIYIRQCLVDRPKVYDFLILSIIKAQSLGNLCLVFFSKDLKFRNQDEEKILSYVFDNKIKVFIDEFQNFREEVLNDFLQTIKYIPEQNNKINSSRQTKNYYLFIVSIDTQRETINHFLNHQLSNVSRNLPYPLDIGFELKKLLTWGDSEENARDKWILLFLRIINNYFNIFRESDVHSFREIDFYYKEIDGLLEQLEIQVEPISL